MIWGLSKYGSTIVVKTLKRHIPISVVKPVESFFSMGTLHRYSLLVIVSSLHCGLLCVGWECSGPACAGPSRWNGGCVSHVHHFPCSRLFTILLSWHHRTHSAVFALSSSYVMLSSQLIQPCSRQRFQVMGPYPRRASACATRSFTISLHLSFSHSLSLSLSLILSPFLSLVLICPSSLPVRSCPTSSPSTSVKTDCP